MVVSIMAKPTLILSRDIKNSRQSHRFPMSNELFRFFIEWFWSEEFVLKKPFTSKNLKTQLDKYLKEKSYGGSEKYRTVKIENPRWNKDKTDKEYEYIAGVGIEREQSKDMLKALIKLKKTNKVGWNNDIPPPLISLIKDFVSKAKPNENLWFELEY